MTKPDKPAPAAAAEETTAESRRTIVLLAPVGPYASGLVLDIAAGAEKNLGLTDRMARPATPEDIGLAGMMLRRVGAFLLAAFLGALALIPAPASAADCTMLLNGAPVATTASDCTVGPFTLKTTSGSVVDVVTAGSSAAITNPSSTLTRPADTTAYAANDLVGSSTTAGSVVVPSFAIGNSAGGSIIGKIILTTSVTTGWGSINYQIDLWRAAPTFSNGDNGAYTIATGAANYLGSYAGTFTQAGDGAFSEAAPATGVASLPKLASGTSVFWTLKILSAATPISGQTFTAVPQLLN